MQRFGAASFAAGAPPARRKAAAYECKQESQRSAAAAAAAAADKKVKGLEEHTEELRASMQRPMDEVQAPPLLSQPLFCCKSDALLQVLQQYRTVSAELQLCRSNYAIISSERVALEVELKAHQEQVQLLLRKVPSPIMVSFCMKL